MSSENFKLPCSISDSSLTNVYMYIFMYMDKKQLGHHAGCQSSAGVTLEINQRNTLHTGDEEGKPGIHPGFETHSKHH